MSFDFKPVDIGEEGRKAKMKARWQHVGRTILYMLAGIIIATGISYLSEGSNLSADEVKNGVFFGAFMGFFLTNSPCARGRC